MALEFIQASLARCRDFAIDGRVVVFDTETTGLSNYDQVVQIAAVEYVRGYETHTFAVYIKPTCPVDAGAEEVHGLSQKFLAANGVSPCEALKQFFDFLGRDVLLVGHNIHFDLRMLRNECTIFDFDADVKGLSFCDTIKLAKEIIPGLPNYRLSTLVETLELVDEQNSHDAVDDTLACGAVFFKLLNMSLC